MVRVDGESTYHTAQQRIHAELVRFSKADFIAQVVYAGVVVWIL